MGGPWISSSPLAAPATSSRGLRGKPASSNTWRIPRSAPETRPTFTGESDVRHIPSFGSFGRQLTRDAAEQLARNWTTLLLNGIVLFIAGVLIFSIDWSVGSLSTFIGALFILEGVWAILTVGVDNRIANHVTGVLSAAVGVAIIAWPSPSLIVLGVFVGSWLIVLGTISISGAFAARMVLSDWWLLLMVGLAEVPLGVLALANPGATLAAIITVGGIWAVAVGAMRIVYAFERRRLPEAVDQAFADHRANGATGSSGSERYAPASPASSS